MPKLKSKPVVSGLSTEPLIGAALGAVRRDLETLRIKPEDERYDRGVHHLAIINARTEKDRSEYISILTRRRAGGVYGAIEMLIEELSLLLEHRWSARRLYEHFVEVEGTPPPVGYTSTLPRVGSLEEAEAMPLGELFVFSVSGVPTPTGRAYKPYTPVVRVQCGDGSVRVVHLSDIPQLAGADGKVRSPEQVRADRRDRSRQRREAKR